MSREHVLSEAAQEHERSRGHIRKLAGFLGGVSLAGVVASVATGEAYIAPAAIGGAVVVASIAGALIERSHSH